MQDLLETLIAHRLAYGFLSLVFHEAPSAALLRTLTDGEMFDAWPLELTPADGETGLETLRDFCKAWQDENLPALKADYQRLFVGPGRSLATPWESVFRSVDQLIFGAQTLQVRRAYQQFAFPTPWLHAEPDDHLGLELGFIAHLCGLGLRALEEGDSAAQALVMAEIRAFLNEHLLSWAVQCLTLVIQNAESAYYRGSAQLALACLTHSARSFSVSLPEAAAR